MTMGEWRNLISSIGNDLDPPNVPTASVVMQPRSLHFGTPYSVPPVGMTSGYTLAEVAKGKPYGGTSVS
jgi:hypothetical protein